MQIVSLYIYLPRCFACYTKNCWVENHLLFRQFSGKNITWYSTCCFMLAVIKVTKMPCAKRSYQGQFYSAILGVHLGKAWTNRPTIYCQVVLIRSHWTMLVTVIIIMFIEWKGTTWTLKYIRSLHGHHLPPLLGKRPLASFQIKCTTFKLCKINDSKTFFLTYFQVMIPVKSCKQPWRGLSVY